MVKLQQSKTSKSFTWIDMVSFWMSETRLSAKPHTTIAQERLENRTKWSDIVPHHLVNEQLRQLLTLQSS
jgi:hypothetical protein